MDKKSAVVQEVKLQSNSIGLKYKNIDVFKYNHHEPIKPHRNREKFFKRLDKCNDKDFIKYINKMSQERLIRRIYKKIVRR